MALAHEATLRWDDFADTLIGDFIVTHEFVRVFLVDTKTDTCKSEQCATFWHTLLQKLVREIVPNASEETINNLANFPIMFKSLERSAKILKFQL